jgi:hypothetical protein
MLSPTLPASAADECIGKPDLQVKQAGHWYYHVDRVYHRRCWFFEASEAPVTAPSSTDRVSAPNADSESWFSRFAAGLAQTFSSEPKQTGISSETKQSGVSAFLSEEQQNAISDKSSAVTNAASPRRPRANKIASRVRSQIGSSPTTNGLASATRHDHLPPQGTSEKDDKPGRQLTPAQRETLFEEFQNWYMDKNLFGRP